MYLDAYAIDRYPVTNAQYKKFIDEKGYTPPPGWHGDQYPSGKANHPVLYVTWHDAQAYAEWAGKRLPTEAEWEKAARGTDGRLWPWGNDWREGHCNCAENKTDDTTPVGIFPAGRSPYGVDDMAANVWEWCADWWAQIRTELVPQPNPQGPNSGQVSCPSRRCILEWSTQRPLLVPPRVPSCLRVPRQGFSLRPVTLLFFVCWLLRSVFCILFSVF